MQLPLAEWNPTRDCWEITQQPNLLSEHWDVFSETWPPSGMTRGGTAYVQVISVPPHARYRVFALATRHGAPPLPISGIPVLAPNPGPLLSTPLASRFSEGAVIPYLARMSTIAEEGGEARFAMSAGMQLTMEHERIHGLGMYTPAIQHWEQQLGRPAPEALTVRGYYHATITPRFCEWMMGLPEGWITDVDGVSDRQAKAMCGNGVVPQQAAAALQTMALWRQVAA